MNNSPQPSLKVSRTRRRGGKKSSRRKRTTTFSLQQSFGAPPPDAGGYVQPPGTGGVGSVSESEWSERERVRWSSVVESSHETTTMVSRIVRKVKRAIAVGVHPTRVAQGSSGTYFVRGDSGKVLGVFKPFDEGPYDKNNPKWMKWFHRNAMFCCFGRACLPPNQGHLSEAGASVVDRHFHLGIVPHTRVVELASQVFNYDYDQLAAATRVLAPLPDTETGMGEYGAPAGDPGNAHSLFDDLDASDPDAAAANASSSDGNGLFAGLASGSARSGGGVGPSRGGREETEPLIDNHDHDHGQDDSSVPRKRGSLQVFMDGYAEATTALPRMTDAQIASAEFQAEFEKLVVIDYIIRNTDRGSDNWLIHLPTNVDANVGADVGSNVGADVGSNVGANVGANVGDVGPDVDPSAGFEGDPPTGILPYISNDNDNSRRLGYMEDDSPTAKGKEEVEEEEGGWKPSSTSPAQDRIRIAAIDNSLAFPHKHPDSVRSYPYGWADMPSAQVPFSDSIRRLLRPMLTPESIEVLVRRLQRLFQSDPAFDAEIFEAQMAVLRGQLYNLKMALKRKLSPVELIALPTALVVHSRLSGDLEVVVNDVHACFGSC